MSANVGGRCDAAFSAVGDAFSRNFQPTKTERIDDDGDVGASVVVMIGGETVVDLNGGSVDLAGTTPWQPDTIVNAYSTMKPVAAVVALAAVRDGLLELDAPLGTVWPELEPAGNGATTLRQVLCHQAGLPAIAEPLDASDLYVWDRLCNALARTTPWWQPGSAHGYHVNTYGFLAGEPAVRSFGEPFSDLVARLVADTQGLDMHVGVRASDLPRCADVVTTYGIPNADESSFFAAADGTDRSTMLRNAYLNPSGISGIGVVNDVRWRRAAVPSTNGHATASALAGFYAATLPSAACPVLPRSLLDEAIAVQAEGGDVVLERPMRYGLGFNLPIPERPIGLSDASYGHYGYGGSLGFADRDADLAFGYLINRPGDRWRNPRTLRLVEALSSCL